MSDDTIQDVLKELRRKGDSCRLLASVSLPGWVEYRIDMSRRWGQLADAIEAGLFDQLDASETSGVEQLLPWERELLERTDTEDLTAAELETLTDGWAEEAAAEEAQLETDQSHSERLLHIHAVVGKLIPILAPFSTYNWESRADERLIKVQSNPHGGAENQRAVIGDIADRLPGFQYAEQDLGHYIDVSAQGLIDGITVKVWDHVDVKAAAGSSQLSSTPPAIAFGAELPPTPATGDAP